MYSIIFFGKPKGDQAIEFYNDSILEISESIFPKFQTSMEDGYTYRQYFNNGFWYLQSYVGAQSFTASRIGDCIGVSFKSKKHLSLTKRNFDILKTMLDEFSKFSLIDGKYKTDNLLEIVKSFLGGYEKFKFNLDYDDSTPNSKKLLLLNNGVINFPNELNAYSDLYITTNENLHSFGLNLTIFSDFAKTYYTVNSSNKLIEYKKTVIETPTINKSVTQNSQSNWSSSNSNEKEDVWLKKHNDLFIKFQNLKEVSKKKLRIVTIFAVVFCLSTLAFFFKSVFMDDKKNNSYDSQSREQSAEYDNRNADATKLQKNQVNLNDILASDDNRNTLNTLLQNIENFEKPLTGKSLSESKVTRYNRIKEDLEKLKLDITFAESYKTFENTDNNFNNNEANKKEEKIKVVEANSRKKEKGAGKVEKKAEKVAEDKKDTEKAKEVEKKAEKVAEDKKDTENAKVVEKLTEAGAESKKKENP